MQISQINVEIFQGVHHAAIEVTEPVLLISGGNGQGKSSLLDSIAMAFTGQPRRVNLRRDIVNLITEGAKKGSVGLHTSEGQFGTELPATKTSVHYTDSNFLDYVLDASAFAKINDKDRRKLLFELTGARANAPLIAEKLASRGISKELIEQVKPLLISGFPAASDHAKNLSSEARGGWKQLAGEVYGSAKAEGWEPEDLSVSVDIEHLSKCKNNLSSIDAELNSAMQSLSESKASATQAANMAKRMAALNSTASLLSERQQELDAAKVKLSTINEEVRAASQAGGIPKSGLIHSMGRFLNDVLKDDSADLGIARSKEAKTLLDEYVSKNGEIETTGNPELAAQLPELKNKASFALVAVTNLEHIVNEALDAAASVAELENYTSSAPSPEAIENAEKLINDLRQHRDKAKAEVTALQGAQEAADNRKSIIQKAAALHKQVQDWSEISSALSPTGIPAEILQDALAPVNDMLRSLSEGSGWKDARVNGDIELTYGERLYGLLSESEKWRVDAMRAITIASLSGLRLVTLDRFDVLEPAARPQALKMLLKSKKLDLIDQAIMAGTMKEPMKKIPAGMQAVWVQEGVVVEQQSE